MRIGFRGFVVIVVVFSFIGVFVLVVYCFGVWNRYREGGNWNVILYFVVIINVKWF